MKPFNYFLGLSVAVAIVGCGEQQAPPPAVIGIHEEVSAENNLFLQQKTFDPWILTSSDRNHQMEIYTGDGATGTLFDWQGQPTETYYSGKYLNGVIVSKPSSGGVNSEIASGGYSQTLNLQNGEVSTEFGSGGAPATNVNTPWRKFWKTSDIEIGGDPEAQQVTHAELFYLCSSIAAGSATSIPPMGLSSNVYNGHIFWDAEIWMMPALLPQHPDLARSIVDYRFNRLAAAEVLAKSHRFAGAEYPWESADTGKEEAPEEFSHERHITADVAYAAWQYYLWTGDKQYLTNEAWPILSANARYWASRAKLGGDGNYHIADVIGPDETAGQVTDDAWTNAIVRYTLDAAIDAATETGNAADPAWARLSSKLLIPYDSAAKLYLQYPMMDRTRHQAKQADTQMLIYPLGVPMSSEAAANTLDYYLQHTIQFGPAMTSSINAVIAARLGRSQQSLDLYHDSYRPFMRGPWDAFSEKRSKSDVYFTTGMGGCLQTVLYGFGGLNLTYGAKPGKGTLIAKKGDSSLYADPHLPPGWSQLTIHGIAFRGSHYTISITPNNDVKVIPQS